MIKNKTVQIPLEIFIDLVKIHLGGINDIDILERVSNALENKLDAIVRRENYTAYKNKNLTDEERERARIKYLNSIGMKERK